MQLNEPPNLKEETEEHHGIPYLVHLTIGAIANHLHQLKDTSRILEEKNKNIDTDKKKKGKLELQWR